MRRRKSEQNTVDLIATRIKELNQTDGRAGPQELKQHP